MSLTPCISPHRPTPRCPHCQRLPRVQSAPKARPSRARRLLSVAALGVVLGLASLSPWPPTPASALNLAQAHSLLAIHDAAVRWDVPEDWLVRVAWCESSMLPYAYNPRDSDGLPDFGLFQFHWQTFMAYAPQIDRAKGPNNAWAAADVAARMFALGQAGQWGCNQ